MLTTTLMLGALLSGSADDPHLWLEEVDGKTALEWVKARNAETADELTALPYFADLHRRARKILNAENRLPSLSQRGDYVYKFWRDATHPRGIYQRTAVADYLTSDPSWETVLDVDALSSAEGEQWVFKGMTCLPPDNQRCLVRLSPGGGDAVEIREFDASALKFIEGGFKLAVAKQQVSWLDKDTVFVGSDFGPDSMTDSGYPRVVKVWQRGTPISEAATVYAGDPSSVSVGAFRVRGKDSSVDLVVESDTFWTSRFFQWLNNESQALNIPATASIEGLLEGKLVLWLKESWTRGVATWPADSILLADLAALSWWRGLH